MGYGDALNSKDDLKGRDGIDLLARMIYSEAGNQTEEGKRGCAFVAKNRKDRNETQFGGNTWEGVILKANQFAGMTTTHALKPDTTSDAWKDSLDIAQNLSGKINPIGGCLWFNTSSLYQKQSKKEGERNTINLEKVLIQRKIVSLFLIQHRNILIFVIFYSLWELINQG